MLEVARGDGVALKKCSSGYCDALVAHTAAIGISSRRLAIVVDGVHLSRVSLWFR